MFIHKACSTPVDAKQTIHGSGYEAYTECYNECPRCGIILLQSDLEFVPQVDYSNLTGTDAFKQLLEKDKNNDF